MNETVPAKPKLLKPRGDMSGVVIAFLVVSLAVFPIISAFNDLLTNWVISLKSYEIITEIIVPQQIKWVVVILNFLGVNAQATSEYILIPGEKKNMIFELIWNCVGWQSLIMFVLTCLVIFSKEYSIVSKLKTIVIGMIGTVLVNVLRIVMVVIIYLIIEERVAVVFHDYASLIINTFWLMFFWSFSYKFLLEKQR